MGVYSEWQLLLKVKILCKFSSVLILCLFKVSQLIWGPLGFQRKFLLAYVVRMRVALPNSVVSESKMARFASD